MCNKSDKLCCWLYRLSCNILTIIVFNFTVCIVTPLLALANGAASHSGFNGSEIIVTEREPFKQFIVDEKVILNFNTYRVTVEYDIENTSSQPQLFKMLFPVESSLRGYDQKCSDLISRHGSKSWDEFSDFKVRFNSHTIPAKAQGTSTVVPEGEYKKLKNNDHKICTYMAFDVRINPGKNVLLIDYNLVTDWFMGDGVGEQNDFKYSIWPAKNWVSKFRKATWRIIIPQHGRKLKHQFDNWFMSDPINTNDGRRYWYKWELNVTGPGTRQESADYVEFTATDYVPSGELNIRYTMHDMYYVMQSAYQKANYEIDKEINWIQTYLQVHPYIGNKMCYQFVDLRASRGYMEFGFEPEDLPYLRNEIYARKGYIFKSADLNSFFSKLSWYAPKDQDVVLNDIEEWNVKFIAEVEKSAKSWSMDNDNGFGDTLKEQIYKRKRAPCPAKGE